MTWMNLPQEYCTEKSKFVILPIEYENSPTFGDGASLGSKEIIKASQHLEYYDEQFDCEAFSEGIRLLEPLRLNEKTPEEMIKVVAERVSSLKDKFSVILGGDHAVTIGAVKGMEKLHPEFSVLLLDAHTDLFHSWNGSEYNHRCVAQRVSDKHEVALIGVRSMDKDEQEKVNNEDNIHLIKSYELTKEKFFETLAHLKEKVYISIDVDVFDPSFIRNTGTPEPGGLFWDQVIGILRRIFELKEVIGCDIVEFAPKENFRSEAYALAKLSYKMFSVKMLSQKI